MLRRALPFLVLLTLAGPQAHAAKCTNQVSDTVSAESEFRRMMADERSSRGLQTLEHDTGITIDWSRPHSNKMSSEQNLHHSTTWGSQESFDRFHATELGENVGYGCTVKSLHDAFMASQGHRDNILKPSFNAVGVGVVVDPEGLTWVTVQFANERKPTPSPATPAPTARPTPRPTAQPDAQPTAQPQQRSTPAPTQPPVALSVAGPGPTASPNPGTARPELEVVVATSEPADSTMASPTKDHGAGTAGSSADGVEHQEAIQMTQARGFSAPISESKSGAARGAVAGLAAAALAAATGITLRRRSS